MAAASGFVDRCPELGQSITVERVPDPFAPPLALDETGLAQDLEVVRHRRLTLGQRLDEVTDADLAIW